jgi:peptide chain release factor subunit 1
MLEQSMNSDQPVAQGAGFALHACGHTPPEDREDGSRGWIARMGGAMHAERFRHLLTAKGPFASVYFDDSHNTADAATQLELQWRRIAERLDERGVGAELLAGLQRAALNVRPPVGRSGRGVIGSVDGVLLNEHLIRPVPATEIRVSELPYIVPVVELGQERTTYVVVAVDHAGGDIARYHDGTARSESVDGGGYPVHKASSAENRGYGDTQPHTEEQVRKNIRAVADRLTSVADESSPDAVFVIGEVRSRTDLMGQLPDRVVDRVVQLHVGARRSGVDTQEVRRDIDAEFLRRRQAAIDDAVDRFRAAIGSGRAVEGLPEVCDALRQGAVDTLIIGALGDATVVADADLATLAPNADVLSELGAAPTRTLRADEALPLLAVSIDASLLRADERIQPAEGIAALLRYAPTA